MKRLRMRIISLAGILSLFCFLIIGRVFSIQIIHGKEYSQKSSMQSEKRKILRAQRGSVKDRYGNVLASSLSGQVEMPYRFFNTSDAKYNVKNNKNARIPRVYPYGELAGALLGYIGKDGKGLSGVEFAFNRYLKGEDGWSIIERDGRNNTYQRIDMPYREPLKGCDVFLTIDLHIQKIVENLLKNEVTRLGAKRGMCILMDPSTGGLLAMANYPGFNPNIPQKYPMSMRVNNCIRYNYEPGSTFKAITSAAAVQEGVISEDDIIDADSGVYRIYGETISDHEAFNELTFRDALAFSSNVCFSKIGNRVGKKDFYNYMKNFGFGAKTGIKLSGEEGGIVHSLDNWSGRSLPTMAIGQEVSVTLLQMVSAFSAVANGGILLKPRIFNKVVDSRGRVVENNNIKIVRRVVSNETALRLRRLLEKVVTDGTGKNAFLDGVRVAGKTGTSQIFEKETGKYSDDNVWCSFIGFTPVEKPLLLAGIMIDEPKIDKFGGAAAAPLFRKIIKRIVNHPQLQYAESIIERPDNEKRKKKKELRVPDFCGIDLKRAEKMLQEISLKYEFVGNGGKICHQVPSAGRMVLSSDILTLYTEESKSGEIREVKVPDCTGKGLKSAVNLINYSILKPYVSGAGTVYNQFPAGGAIVREGSVCTLYCDLKG